MNRWQQQRMIIDEHIRMEDAGEAIQGDDGKWQLTPLGRQRALQEMKEDFGILAPIVRLLDRVKAWRLGVSARKR